MAPLLVTQEQYDRLQAHIAESKIKGMNKNRRVKTSKDVATKIKNLLEAGTPNAQISRQFHMSPTTIKKIQRGHYD